MTIDAARYLADFYAMSEAGGDKIAHGELLRVGPSSIALVPEENPMAVLKIILPKHRVMGVHPRDEFKIVSRVRDLQDSRFGLPCALAWGARPEHILLSRIGERLGDGSVATQTVDPDEVGSALGAFAGKLWLRDHSIHTDLSYGNATRMKDGRIGVIDLASVVAHRMPEQMFFAPLLARPSFAVSLASVFEEVSGFRLDFDRIEKLQHNYMQRLPSQSHSIPCFEKIRAVWMQNLEDFMRLRHVQRPKACRWPLQCAELRTGLGD